MKNQLQINSYLGIVAIASLAFVAETTYFLYAIPMNNDGENWLPPFASWATAFFGQCGIYLTILCPTAAHALSGRWSWSVRILTAVSIYSGGSMAMLTVNAYENSRSGTGSIRTSQNFMRARCYWRLSSCCTSRSFYAHSFGSQHAADDSGRKTMDCILIKGNYSVIESKRVFRHSNN